MSSLSHPVRCSVLYYPIRHLYLFLVMQLWLRYESCISCVANLTGYDIVHSPGPSTTKSQTIPSRADTPSLTGDKANGSSGTGTNTPTSVKDGNLYFDCVNHCGRQVRSIGYHCIILWG